MKLNRKQKLSIKKIHEFINQDVHQYFYLLGYAGTGKTFLTNVFVHDLLHKGVIDNVYICAPTHTALNVLESYFKSNLDNDKKQKKLHFMTIHKLLEFRPMISNEDGTQIFKSKQESKFIKKTKSQLIIIDECSMIPQRISEELDKYKTEHKNIKVIFLGDSAQLPPVSEPISIVFSNIPNDYEYHIVLDEIMRTKSDTIKQVASVIRSWDPTTNLGQMLLPIYNKQTQTKSFKLYHKKSNYLTTSWFKNYINKIKSGKSPIILTWKNFTADTYNKIIRRQIHETLNDDELNNFKIGDNAMFTKYYCAALIPKKPNPDPDENIPTRGYFYTANMIKILGISTITRVLFEWKSILLTEPSGIIDIAFNKLLKKINKFPMEFKIDVFRVERINQEESELSNEIYAVQTISRDDLVEYRKTLALIQEHLEFFFKKYKSNTHSTQLWNIYHNKIISRYAELSFGYSITTHKAQGTTFDVVYVDVPDICDNPNASETIKSLYTATTRASTELNFLLN